MQHELFLINYTYPASDRWKCFLSAHSLAAASEHAKGLRELGYRVRVQSVLINEHGKVSV